MSNKEKTDIQGIRMNSLSKSLNTHTNKKTLSTIPTKAIDIYEISDLYLTLQKHIQHKLPHYRIRK